MTVHLSGIGLGMLGNKTVILTTRPKFLNLGFEVSGRPRMLLRLDNYLRAR